MYGKVNIDASLIRNGDLRDAKPLTVRWFRFNCDHFTHLSGSDDNTIKDFERRPVKSL